MPRTIAIVNPQGNTGKTMTSLMLSYFYSQSKKKVLFIDVDPMGYASSKLLAKKPKYDLYDVIYSEVDLVKAIVPTSLLNVTLIPSSYKLISVEIDKINEHKPELILRQYLGKIHRNFDSIIIDTPSSLGLLTISTMAASDIVVIPILSNRINLKLIAQMLKTIKVIQAKLNKNLKLKGILVNLIGEPMNENEEILIHLKNSFNGLIFNTVVFWDDNFLKEENFFDISAKMNSRTYSSYHNFYKELLS